MGKGEHWTGTGLVSGVHPGTLERHTPTAAEYSPVHWCAFRVRVRCLEQAAVGFLDWLCSNDSNRHIYNKSTLTAQFQTTPALRPAWAGLTAQRKAVLNIGQAEQSTQAMLASLLCIN